MGPWKSNFELVIPGRSPAQLAEAARTHGGKRTKVGLIVRVRDDRIRARYNELSRQSTAPLMKGRLVHDAADTRVVGDIQWTNVMAAPFVYLGLALVLLAVGLLSIGEGDVVFGAVCTLVVVGFAVLAALGFRSKGDERDFEEQRLREELLKTFGGGRGL